MNVKKILQDTLRAFKEVDMPAVAMAIVAEKAILDKDSQKEAID